MADKDYITNSPQAGYETKGDRSYVEDMVSAFVSNTGLRQMLMDVFDQSLGKNFQSHFGIPGQQGSMAFGSSTAFGPQDIGKNLANTLHDQAVSATMGDAFRKNEDLRRESLDEFYGALYGPMNEGSKQRQMNAPVSLTNFMHGAVYDSFQPEQLLAGMEVGARYMGVGATFAPLGGDPAVTRQIALREQVSAMSEGIQEDFMNNPEEYGGLSGQGVGRLYAELAKTGGFQEARAEATGTGDLDQLTESTKETVQQAAKSVRAFRELFQGSVPEVLDQVNALMGVDVLQTFGDQGQAMFQNMSSSGFVAGFNPGQAASFAAVAQQHAINAGVDPMGSVAAGTLTMQLLGVHRQAGGSNEFINNKDLRENMLKRVLGAQESGFARDVAGGFALVESARGNTDEFLKEVEDAQTPEAIAKAVNKHSGDAGRGNVTGMDLRNASFSEAGERARATGVGGIQALRLNASIIEQSRRSIVRRELSAQGVGGEQLRGIMEKISGEGDTTVDKVLGATEGVAGIDSTMFEGQLNRIYGEQARSQGLGKNAHEADAMLRAISNEDTLADIQGSVEGRMRLQEVFQTRGTQFGIQNMRGLIKDINEKRGPDGKGKVDVGYRDLIRGFTGAAQTKLSTEDIAGAFAIDNTALIDAITSTDDKGVTTTTNAMAALGYSIAVEGQFTQQIDGKLITEEQRKLSEEILSPLKSDPDDKKARAAELEMRTGKMTELAKELHGDRLFDSQVEYSVFNEFGLKGEKADAAKDITEKLIGLRQIDALKGDSKGAEVSVDDLKMTETDETKKAFIGHAAALRKKLKEGIKSGETDFDTVLEKYAESQGDKFDEKKFMDRFEEEGMLNKQVSLGQDLVGGPMGVLVTLVTKVVDWLEDHRKD